MKTTMKHNVLKANILSTGASEKTEYYMYVWFDDPCEVNDRATSQLVFI